MDRGIRGGKTAAYLLVTGAAALALAPVTWAQTSVDAFVASVIEGIPAIHAQAGGDAAKTLAGCSDFLGRVLDLPAMAKTAARNGWEQMSAEQRAAYQAAFTRRLDAECARELSTYKGEAVTLAGIRNTPDGDKLATFRLGPPERTRMIAWRLRGPADGLSAVDVIFEGNSVMIKAHDDFIKVLHATHGNIDAVIESLRK